MIHFVQNNDIIIDFGYGNDIAVKITANIHEDGRLEIPQVRTYIRRTCDISKENRNKLRNLKTLN